MLRLLKMSIAKRLVNKMQVPFFSRVVYSMAKNLNTAYNFAVIYSAGAKSDRIYRAIERNGFHCGNNEKFGELLTEYSRLIRETEKKISGYNSLGKGVLERILKEMKQSKKLAY